MRKRKSFRRRAPIRRRIRRKRRSRRHFLGGGKSSFPRQVYTTHNYSGSTTLDTSTTNTNISFSLSINNMFDPIVALGGQQPAYYDDFAGIYAKNVVYAAKVDIWFTRRDDLSSVSNVPSFAYVRARGSDVNVLESDTTADDMILQRRTKWKLLGQTQSTFGFKHISMLVRPHILEGVPKNSDVLIADSGGAPLVSPVWDVGLTMPSNATGQRHVCQVVYRVRYYCKWFQLRLEFNN